MSPDRSHLNATAYPGYEQTIFPGAHAAFDILALSLAEPHTLLLNSAFDVSPRSALLASPGEYTLEYEIFAQGFPLLQFAVTIQLEAIFRNARGAPTSATARLCGSPMTAISSADAFISA